MPDADFLVWIILFSLLPWVMVSQTGLQPGVLAIVGSLPDDASEKRTLRVGRVALATSAIQYIALVLAASSLIFALSKSGFLPESLRQVSQRPDVLIVMAFAGLFWALGSVGNSYMLAIGAARRMAILTSAGTCLFLLGSGLRLITGAPLTAVHMSLILSIGLATPAFGALREVARKARDVDTASPLPPGQARSLRAELNRFMGAQAIWVIPGALVTGLDNILVAEFDATSLRLYSVTLAVMMLGSAGAAALASPFISELSTRAAKRTQEGVAFPSWDDIKAPVIRLSRPCVGLGALAFLLGLAPLATGMIWYSPLLKGSSLHAVPILAAGVSMRILTIPLSTLAISARRQRSLFPSSIGEAAVNTAASLYLGSLFGAAGVAGGTFLGSLVAVAAHGWAAFSLLRPVPIDRRWWLRTVLVPATFLGIAGLTTSVVLQT